MTLVDAPRAAPAAAPDAADALAALLADAARTETPAGPLCLKLARAYRQRGDASLACRWALRVVDGGDDFAAWRGAAALLRTTAPESAPPPLRTARLAIVGSYTTTQFGELLVLAARRLGIALAVYEAPYGQYRQELLDPASGMHRFAPDVVLLCTHHGELALPAHAPAADAEAEVGAEVARWTALWRAAGTAVIQHNFAAPYEQPLGHLASALPGSRAAMTPAVNAALGAAAGAAGGAVSIVDCERLSALFGKGRWFDPRYWHLSKQAVALDALPLLARHTAAVLAARLGLSRKCLVLDLDNTLWGGVIGEDGLGGIRLGGAPEGEAFVAFQEQILALKSKGVILAVVSKNNEADAREPFERHPEMRLRLADVASFVASWEPKSDGIRRVATQLGIGLDAIAFVDDNPAERQIIRELLPEVDVLPLPAEPALYGRALADYLGFETSAFTAEDANRTAQYRARAEGARLAADAGSIEDFYRGLRMQALVAPFDPVQLPRIAQLVGKTNQFNLTTRRHGLAELRALMDDPRCLHLSLRLRDRFADHGLVGVIIGVGDDAGETLDVDTWLMSCRVLGRTADAEMLAQLSRRAAARGYQWITGTYRPTPKNGMVRELYASYGFERAGADADGATRWRYDLTTRGPVRNEYIEAVETWRDSDDAAPAA